MTRANADSLFSGEQKQAQAGQGMIWGRANNLTTVW